jgi:hypothetical protein
MRKIFLAIVKPSMEEDFLAVVKVIHTKTVAETRFNFS